MKLWKFFKAGYYIIVVAETESLAKAYAWNLIDQRDRPDLDLNDFEIELLKDIGAVDDNIEDGK